MKPITTYIHACGLRMTNARKQIFSCITAHPQSVAQIAEDLKKQGETTDTATIYRTVERFSELGLISHTQFQDGTMMYERNETNNHHHHLVCDRCGHIEDIKLDERKFLSTIPKTNGFQIKRHTLEFFGLCKKCRHASL